VLSTLRDNAGDWTTVLLGTLPDQASLNGVLNALYSRRLALRYVAMLKTDDDMVDVVQPRGGDEQ
jgi:hypothetical protein